ncbi:Carboxy-terminal processing protease CtpB [termite gut metagenome]|uniref:Carboxy-terminal processing protease CtpB n=1 Tax=termite gut metagenome TaxID=433724 RepID=A0A5J4SWH2_9ZZZZ
MIYVLDSTSMSTKKTSQFTPIIIAVSIVFGILIGMFYAKNLTTGSRPGIIKSSSGKVNALLRIIDDQYVDTVNINDLVEDVMPQLLAELDPHSTYIPAKRLEEVNSELEGYFSGIGIQFTIQQDTVHVNSVIQGGPSEKVGLMAGDRIITVNDSAFTGKKIDNEIAMRTLKGPKGTHVKLGIKRASEKNLLEFEIIRGDIPQNSVDVAYMLTNDLGYIQISKFGRTTHAELLNALALLNHEGCKGLIIDLRGNTGGYMDAAIRMVNEFLSEGKLIVYTQGRRSVRSESRANGTGSCQKTPLVVLVDEASASASEIFAGAIQDNDRGTIVGRRSFGKGLVQQPFDFDDGSGIRLTIARYYTPSGRCIQRPYENGKDENYEMDIYTRYEHGEFFSRDSIRLDESLRYSTGLGRPVYGGGGIMPDIFVPQDTTGMTSYFRTVLNKGLILQFAFQYTDKNREALNNCTNEASLLSYLNRQQVIDQFVKYAQSKDVKPRNILIQKSYSLLERNLYGNIIYNMLGREAYITYINKGDKNVKKALEILDANEAFPKAPEETIEESVEKKNDGNKKKRTAQADCGEETPMWRLYASNSVC